MPKKKSSPLTDEELGRLYLGVLKDALVRVNRGELSEQDWLFSDDTGPFSYLVITKFLGIHPEKFRTALRRCIKVNNNPIDLELDDIDPNGTFDLEGSPKTPPTKK